MIRAKLRNVEVRGRSESCKKRNCQVCDFICNTDTFVIKTIGETFKIQSGIRNCNFRKVVHLLKYRICGEAPYVGKENTKFKARFNNYKSAHRSYRKKSKVSQQRFHEHYGQHSHNEIDDCKFILIEQCEIHKQLRETFWQHKLRTFYSYGFNERKNIYIKSPFEYISEFLTFPLDTTHCNIELAFDCFVFPFSLATLCDYP